MRARLRRSWITLKPSSAQQLDNKFPDKRIIFDKENTQCVASVIIPAYGETNGLTGRSTNPSAVVQLKKF
jgi:hypothetical protein